MKLRKRLCVLLMAVSLTITAGCGSENTSSETGDSAAQVYIDMAQGYIDEKDYDTAIDILQLGIETVSDEALTSMLEEVISLQVAETGNSGDSDIAQQETNSDSAVSDVEYDGVEEEFDISEYVSCWATAGADWINGGYCLNVYSLESMDGRGNYYQFDFCYQQSAWESPERKVALASASIFPSEITNNEISYSFEDDTWGHSGKLTFLFSDDSISFTVSDVVSSYSSEWGFVETSGYLVESPDLDLYYSQEEYNILHGVDNTPQEPVYDTSKASGILASLGMTEQEFRDSCMPLDPSIGDDYFFEGFYISRDTIVPYVESRELLRNPNAYIGQHFVLARNPDEWIICPECNGTGWWEGTDSRYSCRNSGDYFHSNVEGIYCISQTNTEILVPFNISGGTRFTNDYGETVYRHESSDVSFLIFDMRDDIYNPNITADADVVPYLIFAGASGGNILKFMMISCDVIY